MVYEAFRINGGPTQYAPNNTPVTVDVLEIGFIVAFCIMFLCFALIIPGYKGASRVYFTFRVVISLLIGSAILLEVLGQEWESATITTRTPYKAFANKDITAEIGIKIGQGAVNITLKGDPFQQNLSMTEKFDIIETINYNKRFNWKWRQERIGFRPYAGKINREFKDAQYKGLPLPILWVAEYFTLDGELIRWGRTYRTAGWFTNEVLWTCVPLWLIDNILTFMVFFYAGWKFILTGACMFTSTIIWTTIKWGYQPLVIPFEDGRLELHYKPNFWLVISGGIVSTLYGIFILTMKKDFIYEFFGLDIEQEIEDSEEILGTEVKKNHKANYNIRFKKKNKMVIMIKQKYNLHLILTISLAA